MGKKISMLEELKETACDKLTVDELRELADFCLDLISAIEEDNITNRNE